jgi:hypothetical protein
MMMINKILNLLEGSMVIEAIAALCIFAIPLAFLFMEII